MTSSDALRPDYAEARQPLIELVAGSSTPVSDAFERFIAGLIGRGWTRRDIHRLTSDILDHEAKTLGEEGMDALLDFETSLTGNCHPDCILRFPGEPEDEKDLVAWVRGNQWR